MIFQETIASKTPLAATTRAIFAFIKTFIKTWDRSATKSLPQYNMTRIWVRAPLKRGQTPSSLNSAQFSAAVLNSVRRTILFQRTGK
ncbi:hypothetical protein CGCTS75_v004890 [Colletotrichum tropicale]|nr:hypothetical protein CGCTS75_v004890 [Colletotrichum tropicale]